jgi:hypothetical protein
MKELFDETIRKIIDLLRAQVSAVVETKKKLPEVRK